MKYIKFVILFIILQLMIGCGVYIYKQCFAFSLERVIRLTEQYDTVVLDNTKELICDIETSIIKRANNGYDFTYFFLFNLEINKEYLKKHFVDLGFFVMINEYHDILISWDKECLEDKNKCNYIKTGK